MRSTYVWDYSAHCFFTFIFRARLLPACPLSPRRSHNPPHLIRGEISLACLSCGVVSEHQFQFSAFSDARISFSLLHHLLFLSVTNLDWMISSSFLKLIFPFLYIYMFPFGFFCYYSLKRTSADLPTYSPLERKYDDMNGIAAFVGLWLVLSFSILFLCLFSLVLSSPGLFAVHMLILISLLCCLPVRPSVLFVYRSLYCFIFAFWFSVFFFFGQVQSSTELVPI